MLRRASTRASAPHAAAFASETIASVRRMTTAKPTVVVVGSGWGGARLVRDLDPDVCNMAVMSQRNHMVFTPLLPQTCTGTLEFRSICEPLVNVQPAIRNLPNESHRTMVFDVDFATQNVSCVTVGVLGAGDRVPVESFNVHYDYLVLAHGARPNTFNIPGVEEHAFFLREISEARGIRRRIGQNLMTAALPTTSKAEAQRLLHVVVVGGGPTGVEFAGDLADFLRLDVGRHAPHLAKEFRVTLVEANEVLGTFDAALRKYSQSRLERSGINVKKAIVAEVNDENIVLTDGETLPCGLCVWSTGVGPSTLNKTLSCDKNKQGRLVVNEHLQLQKNGISYDNAFALGDCAADHKEPLPTLAAVASRQGAFLAKSLNKSIATRKPVNRLPIFEYKHLGSMASLGGGHAVAEFNTPAKWDIKGLKAFIVWRSAYFTMLGSLRSRLYVAVNWIGSYVWGRDMTYIAEISEAKLWKNLAREGASKEQARRALLKKARLGISHHVKLGENKKVTKTELSAADAAAEATRKTAIDAADASATTVTTDGTFVPK